MFHSLIFFPIGLCINLAQIVSLLVQCFKKEINKEAFLQRFAINLPKGKFDYWIHCASMGESKVLVCFIQSLIKINPDLKILISFQRDTAENFIKQKLSDKKYSYKTCYFPIDALWVWRIFFKRIKVKRLICIESEIWPKLFKNKARFKLNISLINARISSKSYQFYKKWSYFSEPIFNSINQVYAQSKTNAKRFISLRVSTDSVFVAGNLKYDLIEFKDIINSLNSKIQQNANFNPTLFFISTRKGEETLIKEILPSLYKNFQNLRVLIAPRHQARFNEVISLFKSFNPAIFSQMSGMSLEKQLDNPFLIIDVYGKLNQIYPIVDLVVVGGTLEDFGGHSIIEPSSYAKASLIGPFIDHISDDVDLFLQEDAIIQLDSSAKLEVKIKELLKSPNQLKEIGKRALKLVQKQKGNTQRIAEKIIKNQS